MEFFEFVFVFSVAFVLPVTIIKMSLDYKKAKALARSGVAEGTGVTAGDLKMLLREAVEEANAPLLARIDELEMQVQRPVPTDVYDGDVRVSEQDRTLGRRVAD